MHVEFLVAVEVRQFPDGHGIGVGFDLHTLGRNFFLQAHGLLLLGIE
jgi:hypothetical protein